MSSFISLKWINSRFQAREHQQQMKEFEDQQDAKFEQVEIGNEELLVVFTSTVLIYTEIAHNSLFPTPCFLRLFVCFLE